MRIRKYIDSNKKKKKSNINVHSVRKLNIKQQDVMWGVWAGGADRLWSCLPGAACTSAPALPLENQPPGNQTGSFVCFFFLDCILFYCLYCTRIVKSILSSSAQEYFFPFGLLCSVYWHSLHLTTGWQWCECCLRCVLIWLSCVPLGEWYWLHWLWGSEMWGDILLPPSPSEWRDTVAAVGLHQALTSYPASLTPPLDPATHY